MKNAKLSLVAVMLVAGLVGILPAAFAGASAVTHSVTISVPTSLSLTADTAGFTLTMADYVSGSVSDTQQVVYTVKSNNSALAANAAIVKAKLGTLFSGIDFLANPGAYTKQNGNFDMTENAAGNITVLTSDVPLMKKTGITGSGKTTKGTFPVDYSALATADLDSQSQNQTLTVTLVDA